MATGFRAQLKGFCDRAEERITRTAIEVTKTARLKVAQKTPILTGRASASWNASLNAPDTSTKPETFLNPEGAPGLGNINVDGMKLGDTAYVSNSVPYIGALNNGSSRKAPAAFVEATAHETTAELESIVNRANEGLRR